ncbi:MAG: amidohydrolase family protein [Chitinophagaceae bacterium]|nr:amidohydrolase family protein [Chitinophagaceae bacterium]
MEDKVVVAINCITGQAEAICFANGIVENIIEKQDTKSEILTGPGLIDLQINGINGIDFNTPFVSVNDIINACHCLLSEGVTTFFPTVITNSDENILEIVHTIQQACLSSSLVNECVGGIHLEGPFISPVEGARGAHDKKYIKAPDWDLFSQFQKAAGGKIKIVTIAPEWEDSTSFIEQCRAHGILVSIGHSMARSEHIKDAVRAGATMSTHLGNGVPLSLPRHPNLIWDQLAADELYACIIADGIHIPDSFIKVVIKTKLNATIVVSDATCFAGMPPGEYERPVGGAVRVDEEKRVSLKNSPRLLGGAAKSLLENVETLIGHNLATLRKAWQMASTNVSDMLAKNEHAVNQNNDRVFFQLIGNKIHVMSTIKNGRIVYGK